MSICISLNVTIHIEDANDKTNTQQWYYVADNNTTKKEDVPSWTELTNGNNGDYVVKILDTDFAFGYVYIKTMDQDGNENFAVSPQYQVDIQAPMILHNPMGKREDSYSVVCSDEDYPVIFVEIVDNIGIDAVVINGKTVTTDQNLPVGVGYGWTNPNAPSRTSANSKLYELAKPGDAGVAASNAMTILVVDEDELTRVNGLHATADADEIYSLNGVKMPTGAKLPAGIYIRNGKKFQVK